MYKKTFTINLEFTFLCHFELSFSHQRIKTRYFIILCGIPIKINKPRFEMCAEEALVDLTINQTEVII